jgi:hypothetical protein
MLTASLPEYERAQRSRFADGMSKPIQCVSFSVLHELGVSRHEVAITTEPQVDRPLTLSVPLPKTVVPAWQKAETILGSGLGLSRLTESVRCAPMLPVIAPSGSLLGRLGLESGPTVDLAYAKQLLEHEQVTAARTLLERAVGRYPQDERLRNLYHAIAPGRVVRRDVHYRDRTMETAWIQAHRAQYRGKWVALFGEQVLGIGDNLQTVLRRVREHHHDEPPLIHHFPD